MSAETAEPRPEGQGEERVLSCDVGGSRVAFPLHEVETTLPASNIAPLCEGSAPFTGMTTYLGRAFVIMAPEALPPAKLNPFSRLVVFKNGLAVLVDDLHGLEPAAAAEATPLSMAQATDADAPPQGFLPDQVYLFRFAETALALRLSALHHVRLVTPDELAYSAELGAWQVTDAPGVPIFMGFDTPSAGEMPLFGDRGHVLFVTMGDGSNFGLVLNEGRLDDPGAPCSAQVFEISATAAHAACAEGVVRLDSGDHRALISPDRLFARCCGGSSGASAGQSAGAA